MNLLLWGITLGTVGKLVLGIAVLKVHTRILEEHSIDKIVLTAIKREYIATVFGIIFILLGYIFEIAFYNGSTEFLSCSGLECAGIINAAFSQ